MIYLILLRYVYKNRLIVTNHAGLHGDNIDVIVGHKAHKKILWCNKSVIEIQCDHVVFSQRSGVIKNEPFQCTFGQGAKKIGWKPFFHISTADVQCYLIFETRSRWYLLLRQSLLRSKQRGGNHRNWQAEGLCAALGRFAQHHLHTMLYIVRIFFFQK